MIQIILDATLGADLNWTMPLATAANYQGKEKSILWQIDLFSAPRFPISNEMQCMSLELALDHFLNKIWSAFPQETIGLCLYQGDLKFDQIFPWDLAQEEEYLLHFGSQGNPYFRNLFCRDLFANYLSLLASRLPDELPLILKFDTSNEPNPLHQAQLLSRDRFQHFQLALSNTQLPLGTLSWQGNTLTPLHTSTATIAICIPASQPCEPLQQAFKLREPYRIIPESLLSTEWHDLDRVVIDPNSISPKGLRMLQGFVAAGGQVVSVEEL